MEDIRVLLCRFQGESIFIPTDCLKHNVFAALA